MELKKYDYIVDSMLEYNKTQQPWFFTIEWESIDTPGVLKNWTGAIRITGIEKFKNSMDKLQQYQNCAKIYVKVYSALRGKKLLLNEVITIRDFNSIQQPTVINADQTEINSRKKKDLHPQPQQGIFSPDVLLGALLGFDPQNGGLNGPALVNGLLSVRDERLRSEFEKKDTEKTLAELKLAKASLEQKLESATKENEELNAEIDKLEEKINELEAQNAELSKLLPENTLLGTSLSALGTSILTGFAKKIISNNPENIAKILGTDVPTLQGIFDTKPQAQVQPAKETSPVEIELAEENLSPQRKTELEAINGMIKWLKELDFETLAAVQQIMFIWNKDLSTIPITLKMMTGNHKNNSEINGGDE